MGLFAALALASLAFPQLGDRFWAYVVTDEVGQAQAEIFVAPDGEVNECAVLYTEFRAETNERLCNQLRQNTVAAPGHDGSGQALHATAIYTFRSTIGLRDIGPEKVLWRDPVLEIGVSRLPDGVEGQLLVGSRVVIDATGQVETCEANTRPDDAYTRAACQQLQAIPHPVRHDRLGQPVRYLTDMNVVFITG